MYEASRDISLLKPHMQVKVRNAIAECAEKWCDVRVSETLRSDERQKRLIGHWRTAWDLENNWNISWSFAQPEKSKVTWIRTSKHQLWCAVDIFFNIPWDIYRDSKWSIVAPIFTKHWMNRGFDMWGIDKPHFEDNWIKTEIESETYKSFFNEEFGSYSKIEEIIKHPNDAIDRLSWELQNNPGNYTSEMLHLLYIVIWRLLKR